MLVRGQLCTALSRVLLHGFKSFKLIGRWRSDEVFRYLHTQADPLMQQHASRMLAAAP